MFSVNHGGENLSVLFKRDEALRIGRHGFEDVEQISCAIVGTDNVPKGVGSAVRSQQDDPNDLLGMELALGRALKRLTPDKAVRAEFWDAFYRAASQDLANRTQEAMETLPGYATRPKSFDDCIAGMQQTPTASYDAETTSPVREANMNVYDRPEPGQVYTGEGTNPPSVVLPFKAYTNQARIADLQRGIDRHQTNEPGPCRQCDRMREEIASLQAA